MGTVVQKWKSGGWEFFHDDSVLGLHIGRLMYGFCEPLPFWTFSFLVKWLGRRFYFCKNWNGAHQKRTRWFGYQPKSQMYPTPGRAFFHLTVYYAGNFKHHFHFRVGSWGFGMTVSDRA